MGPELVVIGVLAYLAWRRSQEGASPLGGTGVPQGGGLNEDQMRQDLDTGARADADEIGNDVDVMTARYIYNPAGQGSCYDGDTEKYVDPSVCEKADPRLVDRFSFDGPEVA